MLPDDPRHGTTAGHNAGCRSECCQAAKLRYDKRRRWEAAQGFVRLMPPLGTRRRIRALQAVGYSFPMIAEAADMSPKTIADLCYRSERVSTQTARVVAEVYERLCMKQPTGMFVKRSRLMAARKGWAPPLAWDDIDDPDEMPRGLITSRDDDGIDPVVVDRLLAGDRVRSTNAEKCEAMRRWTREGGSEKSLCDMHGWRAGRYMTTREDAA